MKIVIEDANAGEKLIKNVFNQHDRVNLNQAINKGYELAKHALQNTNFLNYSLSRGADLLPHLKNYAVEYSIIKYIENGSLPYQYQINHNKNKSARYFVLFDDKRKFELCVNQVKKRENIGRKAFYRNKRIRNFNSYAIFDDNQKPEVITERPIYFELNHGYQSSEPYFVVLGIPGQNGKWINKIEISNELTLVQKTNTIKTTVEDIDFNFEQLQDHIEKSEKDV